MGQTPKIGTVSRQYQGVGNKEGRDCSCCKKSQELFCGLGQADGFAVSLVSKQGDKTWG